jgi:hypothetical protein
MGKAFSPGPGGFLAEAFAHMEKQCKTVQERKVLQEKSIRGGEAKPLPYMLSQMNLLLHGLDAPAISYGNSLAVKITELGPPDQVDVILTNPPFGGEEKVAASAEALKLAETLIQASTAKKFDLGQFKDDGEDARANREDRGWRKGRWADRRAPTQFINLMDASSKAWEIRQSLKKLCRKALLAQ